MTREEAIIQLKTAYPKCCKEVNYRLQGGFDNHESPLGQALDIAIEALEQDIKPKGKWIPYHYGAYYECSNCHERNNSRYDRYCKFCGAEMREVEE